MIRLPPPSSSVVNISIHSYIQIKTESITFKFFVEFIGSERRREEWREGGMGGEGNRVIKIIFLFFSTIIIIVVGAQKKRQWDVSSEHQKHLLICLCRFPVNNFSVMGHFLGSCLFVWFDSLSSINNLSVKQGRIFLGWTSTKLG